MKRPNYPAARKVNQVDNYFGVEVADPYRWLENDGAAETAAWIAAQNSLTGEYLSQLPLREELSRRMYELLCYPRYYEFVRRGPYLLFKRNDGLQNQLVLHVQIGLSGVPEILVDPIDLAPDGTVRVTKCALSKGARYLAYGLAASGSEWETYLVKDMHDRQDLSDRVEGVKASTIAWRGEGFYYSRYPTATVPCATVSGRNVNHQVWYHRVGTPQSLDALIHEDSEHPFRVNIVRTTDDERFAILTVADFGPSETEHTLSVMDLARGNVDFMPVVESSKHEFRLVDTLYDGILFLTNLRAPNRRLVLIDPRHPREEYWKEIVPETDRILEHIGSIGGKLFAVYRQQGIHELCVFDREQRMVREISLPGEGVVRVYQGQPDDAEALWSFENYITPPTIYRYDIAAGTSTLFAKPTQRFDPGDYVTKQAACRSKDDTRVPLFIVHRKDADLDGECPLLLHGYGGNGFSVEPCFDPLLVTLLERGLVVAFACLRGGGEFGEVWHQAGTREKKQNVFDDCIAAAEWLQQNGYTRSDRSALAGSSNGGLLVGAVMTQRPDLFKVALPSAGVMDMLRFQHFTMGWSWSSEYGLSDEPAMVPVLLAYSPLHRIRPGVSYPATLVTASEDDDCVVPSHSYKFIATLQACGAGPNPYLIRIESGSGHGQVNLAKAIDERADAYAFLLSQIGSLTRTGR